MTQHLKKKGTKYAQKANKLIFIFWVKTSIFRQKLEKRRVQCVAFCQQELPSNAKSTSSSSSPSTPSLSSSRCSNVNLGKRASQAPAFSDAVLLHHHPEKGRHGVRRVSFKRIISMFFFCMETSPKKILVSKDFFLFENKKVGWKVQVATRFIPDTTLSL